MANEVEEKDFSKLSLAELKNLAEVQLQGTLSGGNEAPSEAPVAPVVPEVEPVTPQEPVAEAPQAEPVAAEEVPTPEAPAVTIEPESVPEPKATKPEKWSRTIIGEDGSERTISASTKDELIDRLVEAQQSLLKKQAALRAKLYKPAPVSESGPALPKPTTLTEDEASELAQELVTSPATAFEKLLRSQVGLTSEQLRAELESARNLQAKMNFQAQTQAWLKMHPEYIVNPKNGARMTRMLSLNSLTPTPENLERVFQELREDGLLDLRNQEAPATPAVAAAPVPAPPVAEATPKVETIERKPTRSGVPVRNTAPAPPLTNAQKALEMGKLTSAQLRAKAEAEFAALQAAQRP